jgi:glycine/D-amino acid oxidase-like deaminating enzyme
MKYEVFWKNPGYQPRKPLARNIDCDYLIVGGGITGVSLAYFLSRAKSKKIVLIEKETVASGATGQAAGILTLKGELDLQNIIADFGKKKGLAFWQGNHKGLRLIREIIRKEKIECDYDPENTIYACTKRYERHPRVLNEYIVEKDIEKTTRLLVGKELMHQIKTPLFRYAILSKGHALSVDPLKLTQNLSRVLDKRGVRVYERTPLLRVTGHTAATPQGNIAFKKLILAIDADARNSKMKRVESTIVVTNPLSNEELRNIGLTVKKVVWDSQEIYHYLKITRDKRILLGYGDHPVSRHHKPRGPHAAHLARIKVFLSRLFPNLHNRIEYAWSATFGETAKKVPVIERKGDRLVVAGAASQVVCVMTAKHIADKLLGKHSALESFFKRP